MGILTRVTVRIAPLPEKDDVYGIFFSSWEQGRQAVCAIAGNDIAFSMLRLSNPAETKTNLALAGPASQIGLLKRYLSIRGIQDPEACMALIGFTGSRRSTTAARRAAFAMVGRYKGVCIGKPMGRAWKKNRFRAAYLRNALWDLGYAVDTLETAVTWDKVTPAMLAIEKSIHEASNPANQRVHVFSHLSHVYPSGSSIYTTIIFRLSETPRQTLENWRHLKQAASQAVQSAGGTISHQHGVGADHRKYLAAEKGEIGVAVLQKIFDHLDPDRRMNPDKLLP